MELERGVVGDLATLVDLRDAAAERGTLERCGELVHAARAAGVPVIHCVAKWRSDRAGTPLNTPLTRALARNPAQILEGTEAVDLVPELGDTASDFFSERRHGLAPFHGTDLESLLRSLGVRRLVVCGVSLNVGVVGLCLGAVDRGFDVTVASDAVVGVPAEYGDQVLRNTVAMIAELSPTAELARALGGD
jgi:nicotinamidase-related amidase